MDRVSAEKYLKAPLNSAAFVEAMTRIHPEDFRPGSERSPEELARGEPQLLTPSRLRGLSPIFR
jgi:hypothetical protein